MDRLTSDKDVKDMGMVELAYNSCYCKNGRARYRDYDTDIDTRQFAIELLERYAGIPKGLASNNFDYQMIDYMSYGIEDIKGLIALVYRNLWVMTDLRENLKRYEDTGLAPEQIQEMDKIYQELSREVMAYRKIGTAEECRAAVERQKPHEPEPYETQNEAQRIPRTNADRIRTMTNEELAELLDWAENEGYHDSSIAPGNDILGWLESECDAEWF